jgi:two-component system NtrC family response regulator
LRFLQDQQIERVGGREQIMVDARTLASTNRDLKSAVQAGTFREDLYFRLCVIQIDLPPLREREGDIVLLAKSFLNRFAKENNKKISGFSSQAIVSIEHHDWPGNVRELEHRIKRAIIMADGSKIVPKDLELNYFTSGTGINLKQARESLDRVMILKAISRSHGNLTKAASELGISRPSLYNLIEKMGKS